MPGAVESNHCPTPRKGSFQAIGTNWLAVGEVACQRWSCSVCGHKKAWKLGARIKQSTPNRFITLTHKPKPEQTQEEALREMRADWHTLQKALNRRQKGAPIAYVCIVEWTKAGQPHLHILANCDYIRQRVLSGLWGAIHSSPIVDVRAVKELEKTTTYLSKYLTKDTFAPPRMRRWSASRGFLPALPPYVNPNWPEETTYRYDPLSPVTLTNRLIDAGWTPMEGPSNTVMLLDLPREQGTAPPDTGCLVRLLG